MNLRHKCTEMRGKRREMKENDRKNWSFWGVQSEAELNTNRQTMTHKVSASYCVVNVCMLAVLSESTQTAQTVQL